MTHILEDSTHKIEGQPPKKEVIWVPVMIRFITGESYLFPRTSKQGGFWELQKAEKSTENHSFGVVASQHLCFNIFNRFA